jgi:RNA polymerase sigma-70 factor, ECF subfamily
MNAVAANPAREAVEALYRDESRRIFATLVRLLGDFGQAEEALHEAFRAALEQWPRDGLPANPRAWLVSAGRFKIIDRLRRQARFEPLDEAAEPVDPRSEDGGLPDPDAIEDDRLRLIFTCCHPALAPDARLALTLREVCGLSTEEIARAFLTTAPTLAQRIVRAKARIRSERIPYEVPAGDALAQRLEAVLKVVYLVFNEGYLASAGTALTRRDLSAEAIRLGRLLVGLLPLPEVEGLLALMLLHESRRLARSTPDGELVLLDQQDRSLWDRGLIAEGRAGLLRALGPRVGPYALQAAIAAVHADAADAAQTDWAQIVGLYDRLLQVQPSPVVELNRAAAVAMRDGPAAGLDLIEALLARGELGHYLPAHATRAELWRRLDQPQQARMAFERALTLARTEPQQRFLRQRLADLSCRFGGPPFDQGRASDPNPTH